MLICREIASALDRKPRLAIIPKIASARTDGCRCPRDPRRRQGGVTQEVSRLAYGSRIAEGEPLASISYRSRIDDHTDNWAVFEPVPGAPTPLHVLDAELVRYGGSGVTCAISALGLRV